MNVKEVSLRVLAPRQYYDVYADSGLTWLSKGLGHGVRALVAQKTDGALSMDFGFQAFPPDFVRPFKKGEEVSSMANMPKDAEMCRILISAMGGIEPVWCKSEIATP